jgi:hypothetical protein
MNETVLWVLLRRIEAEWRNLRPKEREGKIELPPWGVWIRLLEPLPPDLVYISYTYEQMLSQCQAVWFPDECGRWDKSVWAYHRFVTVHHIRPWCSRFDEPFLPSGKRYHEIAVATIAPYQKSGDWYLGYQWGGL